MYKSWTWIVKLVNYAIVIFIKLKKTTIFKIINVDTILILVIT